MSDDDAGESRVEITGLRDERKVGIAAVVKIAHVHPAVEHDPLPPDGDHDAALSHLLPRT